MSNDIEAIIQKIEDDARKEMEEKIVENLTDLLDRYIRIDDLETCKRIIDHSERYSGSSDLLNTIYYYDNIELFLYVVEKLNLILTDEIFGVILYQYHMATVTDREHREGKIINFILEKYPTLCTDNVIDRVIGMRNISLIQKLRKISPIFHLRIGHMFDELYSQCLRQMDKSTKNMLEYLINEGFRPEYYSSGFNVNNPRSFTFQKFLIDWNKLPVNYITITHIDTQSKITIRRLGPFDDDGDDVLGDDEIRILVEHMSGSHDLCLDFLQTHGEYIFEMRTLVNDRGATLLADPIFAPLKEPPSLYHITRILTDIERFDLTGLPAGLLSK